MARAPSTPPIGREVEVRFFEGAPQTKKIFDSYLCVRRTCLARGLVLAAWAPRLRDQGTTLTRHPHWPGERVHLAHSDIDLETHITNVVRTRFEDLRNIVLLGHSYAGLVITGAADRIPDHISRLVYPDTAPLPDGVALIDTFPVEAKQHIYRLYEERTERPDMNTLARLSLASPRWNASSNQVPHTGTACGLPSGLTVATQ